MRSVEIVLYNTCVMVNAVEDQRCTSVVDGGWNTRREKQLLTFQGRMLAWLHVWR